MNNGLENRLKWIAMNDALLFGMAGISAWYDLWPVAFVFAGLAAFGTVFVLLRGSPES